MNEDKLTPMMRQYLEIKKEHQDKVLFFRLGDFYEMFYEDAIEVSGLINLTLTKRQNYPMCGIPYHAAKNYIKRLLDLGKKIAICEQISLPESSKEIAKREVVQIYTPGTVIDDEYLDSFSSNFVLSVNLLKGNILAAFTDISTGEFYIQKDKIDQRFSFLSSLISSMNISEILVSDDLYFTNKEFRKVLDNSSLIITKDPSWHFSIKEGLKQIKKQFLTDNLKGFGLDEKDEFLTVIGALFNYLFDMAKSSLPQINNIITVNKKELLSLDEDSEKNLELIKNLHDGKSTFTLFSALNQTKTSAGSRELKHWILHPTTDIHELKQRQDWIEGFITNRDECESVRSKLSLSSDCIRLSSKFLMKKSNPRDLLATENSLSSFFSIINDNNKYLSLLENEDLNGEGLINLAKTIRESINPDTTAIYNEGTVILDSFDSELDELRRIVNNSEDLLKEYLNKVKEDTGLTILKLGNNKIIGHFLEVSKGQLNKVPDNFIRRQTLVNGERFTTPELSELESKINSAFFEAVRKEREVYNMIVNQALSLSNDIHLVGKVLSKIDTLQSLATTARIWNYTRPEILEDGQLELVDARHPVVEQHLNEIPFTANSISTDNGKRFNLITGPNMAGKSTFLRQTALIVLLAHIGSFVPAKEAKIPITDKIFCRVGASDNLAKGESTFLLEMSESSYILRNATRRSLVIMDEIGRGTSTQDGMSLAFAIEQYLLNLDCITLFATHYHELTMLDTTDMQLLTLEVKQDNKEIIFVRKVIEGVAESSYGLHVAKLAGIPQSVIRVASKFQKKHFAEYQILSNTDQMDLFVDNTNINQEKSDNNEIIEILDDFDITNSTPLDALLLVQRLKTLLSLDKN